VAPLNALFDLNAFARAVIALVYLGTAVRTLLTLLRPGVNRHLAGLDRRT
jgi:hypothetical protein